MKNLWIRKVPTAYFILFFISFCAISSVFTFIYFGPTVLVSKRWNYSIQRATFASSLTSITNAVSYPVIGPLVGVAGKRSWFLLLGTTIYTTMYFLFTFVLAPAEVIFAILGLGQSFVDIVLFPSIGVVGKTEERKRHVTEMFFHFLPVSKSVVGKANSLCIWGYNWGLLFLPLIVGSFHDQENFVGGGLCFCALGIGSVLGVILLKVVAPADIMLLMDQRDKPNTSPNNEKEQKKTPRQNDETIIKGQ